MTKCTVQGCVKDAGDKPLCLFHWKEKQGFSQTSLQPTSEPSKPTSSEPSAKSCPTDLKDSIREVCTMLKELAEENVFERSVAFSPEDIDKLAITLFIQKRMERR